MTDDSKSIHAYVKVLFSETPHELCHSFSGEETLDILEKDQKFDLLLMDWEMPGITGPETVEKIVASGVVIPTIMVTSKNETNDIIRALTVGAVEYVMKPFTQTILFEKISLITGVAV
jgi:two-component system chemotaxis response regulator CheY